MSPNLSAKSIGERDRDILAVLALRVRVLSVRQVARVWWSGTRAPLRNARRRLEELEQAGMLESLTLLAHPELPLSRPLVVWQPGQKRPDFARLARALKSRWIAPDRATPAVIATEEAGRMFGGSAGRRPRPSEATHDLHLAAVYLLMRKELPTRALSWIPEARLPKGPGIKVPDALVRDGRDQTAIEFGGEYPRAKLAEFHEHCVARHRGYEIW